MVGGGPASVGPLSDAGPPPAGSVAAVMAQLIKAKKCKAASLGEFHSFIS